MKLTRISLLLLAATLISSDLAFAEAKFSIPATDKGLPGEGPIRRYGWFQKLWESKRSGWAKKVEQDQEALVFLGDSITQGWGENMGNSFPGVNVANRGISGDTTRGVLIRMKGDVLSLNPKGVVILIGTNDLEEKASPEVIAGNLKLIIAELKKHNAKMPIILCNTFPSSASKRRPADQIKKINQLYFATVKGDPQITVLDTWLLFADAKGDAKKPEFPDLLHPNKLGYAKWAAALRPLLATHGFIETKSEDFTMEPGFVSLFNGKDLTGWGFRAKKTFKLTAAFDGKKASDDGRYRAINGRLVVTTPPEGRRIAFHDPLLFPFCFAWTFACVSRYCCRVPDMLPARCIIHSCLFWQYFFNFCRVGWWLRTILKKSSPRMIYTRVVLVVTTDTTCFALFTRACSPKNCPGPSRATSLRRRPPISTRTRPCSICTPPVPLHFETRTFHIRNTRLF